MQIEVVGVKFRNSNHIYSFSPNGLKLKKGDKVLVESERGNDIATVVSEEKIIDASVLTEGLKNVLRLVSREEEEIALQNDKRAKSFLDEIKNIVKKMGLEMKVISIEGNYDLSRITVNFTAEDRVDFRALAKKLAEVYKTRVELHQIGPRDAVRIMGGLGLCGKECCCCQGFGDCEHVSIKMAKNQNLSLNPSSISGVCGKLLCCLAYENENYLQLLKQMPKLNSIVETLEGKGKVVYNDLFKKIVSVRFDKESISEVKEFEVDKIKFENKQE